MKKYGIMGGTFDPIHLGHLFIAETALREVQLDKIIFVPTGTPPHKYHRLITDGYHRLVMTSMAINSNEKFYLSDIEINRSGDSYTIDTIKYMLKQHKEPTEFHFIIGSDAFVEIETWKNYIELFHLIKFVVTTRAGYDNEELNDKINYLKETYSAEVIKMSIPNLEISSSDLRNRIKEERSIKYMVTEDVERYIQKNYLYI
ncbi:MAG: nicotinate-nucleotide adenylyltransferase [Clostridiaceae bacterium]|nr:nicotinate-nucleotide adenylyltransferase [Clostridiaceae bacterium]